MGEESDFEHGMVIGASLGLFYLSMQVLFH